MANIEKHGTGYIYGLAVRLLPMLLPVLLLASCNGRGEHVALLDRADSLLSAGSYDEARRLTDSIGTGHLSRSEEMRRLLLLADISNQCYEPLPSDSIMQQVTDYYDANGTPNEQMRAYYLRGYAAYTRGETPVALDFYNQAIEHADTMRKDCDYRRMAIIESQISNILNAQYLPNLSIKSLRDGERYALIARDTLLAIDIYSFQAYNYDLLGMKDSVESILLNTYNRYKSVGDSTDAAISVGMLIQIMTDKGMLDEAGEYMMLYEQESGFFDEHGNIADGHEIYYYTKGLYLLGSKRYDEAEAEFRKNLYSDNLNLVESSARGLASLYEQTNKADSASKYYHLALQISDKQFKERSTERLQSMMASYNFSRYQQEAGRQAVKAARQKNLNVILMISSFAMVFALSLILFHFRQRARARQLRQEEEKRQLSDRLEKEKEDLRMIQQQRYDEMQKDKNNTIAELENHLKQYHLIRRAKRKESFDTKKQRSENIKQLCNSSAIVLLNREASKPSPDVTEAQWEAISREFDKAFPTFMQYIISNYPQISTCEKRICMLIRLGFKPGDIGRIMDTPPDRMSKVRSCLMQKIFHKDGGSPAFDKKIKEIP